MVDHYQKLGIPSDAGIGEIRKAYRTLARRYHPDVNPNSEASDSFLQIAEAYRSALTERKVAQDLFNYHQAEVEKLYRQQAMRHRQPELATAAVPPTVRWALNGLTWVISLFFVCIPFWVFYQLSQKGLSGWPSLAFLPLVIGGFFSMYLLVRFRRGSVS